MKKWIKNFWKKAKENRWIEHFILFILSGGILTWIRSPYEWPIRDNTIAYLFVGFILALLWEKFQVFVSGSKRHDLKFFKLFHKLRLINLDNNSIGINWPDVLVSTVAFGLGSLIVQILILILK